MADKAKTRAQIRAIQVKKTGLGVSGRIYWESTLSDTKISSAAARDAQAEAGYHEMGYGFFDFRCEPVEGGWKATWTCSASCD